MKIRVFKPFRLNMGADGIKAFHNGVHEVSKEEAEHWYTKLHAEIVVPPRLVVAEPPKKKKGK